MKEIEVEIGLLYGSMYYKKVGFEVLKESDSTQALHVKVVEDNPAKLKLSFYYDTENSLGLNLNLTLRNLLLKNSRLILDGFVSENPIASLKYLKYMGVNQKGFMYLDAGFTKDSRFTGTNLYDQPSDFNYQEFIGNVGFAYTVNNSWIFSVETGVLGAKATPTSNPDSLIKSLKQSQLPIRAYVKLNTFNKAVFPTKGTKLYVSGSYSFDIKQTATLQSGVTSITPELVNELLEVDPYFLYRFSVQQYLPIHPKVSVYADAKMDFANVPICVETIGGGEHYNLLKKLALSIGSPTKKINSDQRRVLHLAAVFINNFTNQLYRIGHEITESEGAEFDLLKPLILETAKKVQEISPYMAQTGPAKRHDKKTIKKQLKQLENKHHKDIYELLTNSIQKTHGRKKL